MRIEQLEYLLAIANSGSISAVAKRLYISQTTLSTMVQSIEAELGSEIFRRTARGVVTTPYGEKALPVMQRMVDSYYTLKSMDREDESRVQYIHICSYPCACNFWSLKITGILKEQGVNAILTMHEAPENKIMARILDGTVSIGLGMAPCSELEEQRTAAQKNDLVLEPLFEDGPAIHVSPQSPLAERESVSLADLADAHLATTNCCLAKAYESDLSRQISHISVFSNVETVKNSVYIHDMISIMPDIALQEAGQKLVRVPVTGNEDNRFVNYLLYPKVGQLSRGEQAVLDGIRSLCAGNQAPCV